MHGTGEWSWWFGYGHGMVGQIFWVFALGLVVAAVLFALFSRK